MTEPQVHSWIMELRKHLSSPPPRRLPPTDSRQAAVLAPLYVDAGELWTLLTKRTDKLPHHKGQIAFPGGSLEAGEDPWDAALRETHEEVGIATEKILRLGELDEAETPTGFHIVPCVGAVPFPVETQINGDEIEELFPVPISAFANPRAIEDRLVKIDGADRMLRIYHVGRHQVWGLTANIMKNLLQRLGLEQEDETPN
ncbi:MAG: CoA pyrophosphatase [bacterium]|nr:CoA pyrophosphatase [bacterium]